MSLSVMSGRRVQGNISKAVQTTWRMPSLPKPLKCAEISDAKSINLQSFKAVLSSNAINLACAARSGAPRDMPFGTGFPEIQGSAFASGSMAGVSAAEGNQRSGLCIESRNLCGRLGLDCEKSGGRERVVGVIRRERPERGR